MRSALAVVFILVATSVALPSEASGPVAPTLHGPSLVAAARPWGFSGQLVVDATGTPVLLAEQTIGIYVDGVRVAEQVTDAGGNYLVRLSFAPGTHTVEARAFEGSLVESASAALTVAAYPTWPSPPGFLHVGEGFYYNESNVTWNHPSTDGGYPVTSYQVDRSDAGGPYVRVFEGLALNFMDTGIVPGGAYAYRVSATTDYATSNFTHRGYDAELAVATVEVVGFRICTAANCTEIADGGEANATSIENVSVTARLAGIVDHWPVSPPGLEDRNVYATAILPHSARSVIRHSFADGTWEGGLTDLWAYAPVTGCETFDVVAHARTDAQGRTESFGSFTLCVVEEEDA